MTIDSKGRRRCGIQRNEGEKVRIIDRDRERKE